MGLHRPRLAGAALALLILAAALSAPPAGAESAYFSWDPQLRQSDLTWPGEEEQLTRPLYLVVETAQPVDSLGFYLRWAGSDAAGRLAVTGLRPAGDHTWQLRAQDTTAAEGSFERFATWLSDPGFLHSAAEPQADGGQRYLLALDLTLGRARGYRIEATGLSVKLADGERSRLSAPAATVGAGWTLQLPPLVTHVTGKLNWRYIRSRISLHGYDLDRLVRVALLDNAGHRVLPVGAVSRSRERMDLNVTNKFVALGLCDIEIGGPNGTRDTLRAALEVAMLKERQLGDENLGIVPGGDDEK